jgi:putative flippase GtrA
VATLVSRGRFMRFAVVGATGFFVDAALLSVLISQGLGVYSARLASFPAAVTWTWLLNRLWGFRDDRTHRATREWARYVAVQTFGALVNFLVYSVLLASIFNERTELAIYALAAGSAAGMIVNYVGAAALVFVGSNKDTHAA